MARVTMQQVVDHFESALRYYGDAYAVGAWSPDDVRQECVIAAAAATYRRPASHAGTRRHPDFPLPVEPSHVVQVIKRTAQHLRNRELRRLMQPIPPDAVQRGAAGGDLAPLVAAARDEIESLTPRQILIAAALVSTPAGRNGLPAPLAVGGRAAGVSKATASRVMADARKRLGVA